MSYQVSCVKIVIGSLWFSHKDLTRKKKIESHLEIGDKPNESCTWVGILHLASEQTLVHCRIINSLKQPGIEVWN